ncbi:hypothetical protein ACFSJY_10285 [Thalassotalea euphylliae]|uniref:hypothetical protein n=1 Tax=Thalassotalea euphylliae TaxID=1655234 RepID=UPI00362C49EA
MRANNPLIYFMALMTPLSTLLIAQPALSKDSNFPLIGKYLGQEPPSDNPEPFAPGIVSTQGYEYIGLFAPDMTSFYFIRGGKDNKSQEFVTYRLIDDEWKITDISPRAGQPFITTDGKTMHLGRRYKERTNDGWSDVRMLDAPFNDQLIMRMTASSNGTRYFDTYDEKNDAFPLRYSRHINGKFESPKPLAKHINTGTYLNHPFIAPDESYLIWDAKKDEGFGDSDLYISYRQNDGSWGEAINLGSKINSATWDAAGHVSPDGKYFFFNRMVKAGNENELPNVDLYWVDAGFIEELRPKS